MPSVNDPHHASVIKEAQSMLVAAGWILADAGYEHVYQGEFKEALSKCDHVAAHVIRTRADRIALHESTGRVIWYDAKTTFWKRNSDFPIEALPFLKACHDAHTFGIHYVFCCQRQDGSSYGIRAGCCAAQLTQRLLVPKWRRGDDFERWKSLFGPLLETLGSSAPIMPGNCTRGGGDAFIALGVDSATLPTWQTLLMEMIS